MGVLDSFLNGFEKSAARWQKMFSRLSPASKAKLAHPGTPEGAVTSKEPTKMSPSGEGIVRPAIKYIRDMMWGSYDPAKHARSSRIADLRSRNLRRRIKEEYPLSKKLVRKGQAPRTVYVPAGKGEDAHKGVILPGRKSGFYKLLNRTDPGAAVGIRISAPAHEGAEAKAPMAKERLRETELLGSKLRGRDLYSLSRSKQKKLVKAIRKEDPGLETRRDRETRNEARKGIPSLTGHVTPNVYTAETGAGYGHPRAFHEMRKIREAPKDNSGKPVRPIDSAAYAKMRQMGMTPWRPLSDSPRVEKGLRKAVSGASQKMIDERITDRLKTRKMLQQLRESRKQRAERESK